MRRLGLLAALVLVAVAAACGGSSPTEPVPPTPTPAPTATPTPVGTASLSGTVTEVGAGTPVAGARVVIRDATRVTGADGGFSVTGLSPGGAPIVVTKEGYLAGGQLLQLLPGENRVALTLEPVAPEGACTFVKDGTGRCLPTTKAGCDALGGSWLAGAMCTAPPPPGL